MFVLVYFELLISKVKWVTDGFIPAYVIDQMQLQA